MAPSADEVVVRFLGSGDVFGSGGRFQTCFLVGWDETAFLIDCGASSLTAMQRAGVDPDVVDAILITHLHGDHFGGLPFFVLDAQLRAGRTRPLVVAGPPGVEDRVRQAMEVMFPGLSEVRQKFAIQFTELVEGREAAVGAVFVTVYAVVHASGAPAYALRVRCGDKVVAYSGDTEWTDALLEVADDADLFICEAYFYEKRVKYHLDYRTLMAHRSELACRRLVVTHMTDDMLRRLPELDVEAAEDGMSVVV